MTTPIRRQYLEIKRRFPGAIVFFRLGDFYETFDEDAELVARELEITLTSKPLGRDLRVPLAGVPHHSLEAHLKRLVSRGHKVAVCEQMEDPRKAKGIVQREVVRVVTPGTVVEESLLSPRASNYLAAVAPPGRHSGEFGLAYVDIASGEFAVTQTGLAGLTSELERIRAAEIIVPAGRGDELPEGLAAGDYDGRAFEPEEAGRLLREHLGVVSLEGFGLRGRPAAVAAAGAVLAYVLENQRAGAAGLRDLRFYDTGGFLVIDPAARRHLELTATLRDGGREGSLIDIIDMTRTAMGSRLLGRWLGRPLLDVAAINARLDRVEAFLGDGVRRARVRELLGGFPDVERITGRLVAGSATPRDLAALRRGLEGFEALLAAARGEEVAGELDRARAAAAEGGALLAAAIADDPAPAPGEGGVIRPGFSPELDEARTLTGDARQALAALEGEERERTGIRSLRVAYNRVFGYYIEVSKANLALVPPEYQRKQTLVGAERFLTPRLKELEERILRAREVIGELETSLFRGVCGRLASLAAGLRAVAAEVAETDVYSALAEVAGRYGYVRPAVDESEELVIDGGRHPVVERMLGAGRFVPNDTRLSTSDAQVIVLTGPNMAGKSTYLRQVALIVILAQMGSCVPAASARIGLVDRVFTRIGGQDDLARGESTFMVEMLETAAILRGATRRSLVLFDEVGRGTSTYDGLAIARAVVDYLHNRPGQGARTLFATHYQEMTALESLLPRVRNYNVAVAEQEGRVVFLHRIVPGGADRSYGIHVAELAGMPVAVVERAREVLRSLEEAAGNGRGGRRRPPAPQLPLLAEASAVEQELAALDPDALTPLQALTKLYELKSKLR
jgi:DNA mismatch repair protein MutS